MRCGSSRALLLDRSSRAGRDEGARTGEIPVSIGTGHGERIGRIGLDGKGLPVGLHLVANYFDEAAMLNIAHRYQQATDWHLRKPTMMMPASGVTIFVASSLPPMPTS